MGRAVWRALIGLGFAACAGAPAPDVAIEGGVRRGGALELRWSGPVDARRVPLELAPFAGGRGTAGSADGWTVRLLYGPADGAGCPELPGHVQVKLGAQPILRQNTWLRVDDIQLWVTGRQAWLVLANARRGEAIELGGARRSVTWTHDESAEEPRCPPE